MCARGRAHVCVRRRALVAARRALLGCNRISDVKNLCARLSESIPLYPDPKIELQKKDYL